MLKGYEDKRIKFIFEKQATVMQKLKIHHDLCLESQSGIIAFRLLRWAHPAGSGLDH